MHNHIEATLIAGRTVVNGREYQISFRARWLAGNNLLNTRLYFNRVGAHDRAARVRRSTARRARQFAFATNIGPTFSDFGISRSFPQPGEPVTVSVSGAGPARC